MKTIPLNDIKISYKIIFTIIIILITLINSFSLALFNIKVILFQVAKM
jgi:hypothetical protein